MTCGECSSWIMICIRLFFTLFELAVTTALFIKGANDYAEETLSSSTLQRIRGINYGHLDNSSPRRSFEVGDMQHFISHKWTKTLLDPADILKVCNCDYCSHYIPCSIQYSWFCLCFYQSVQVNVGLLCLSDSGYLPASHNNNSIYQHGMERHHGERIDLVR